MPSRYLSRSFARISDHLSPARLKRELEKLRDRKFPIYIVNMKPMYRNAIIEQLAAANIPQLEILNIGQIYEF